MTVFIFYVILPREQQCECKAWDNIWNILKKIKVNIILLNITEYLMNAIKHNTWFKIWHCGENFNYFKKKLKTKFHNSAIMCLYDVFNVTNKTY